MLAPLRRLITALLILAALPARFDAQRAPIGDAIKDFVSVDAPVVALTNARVVDGTGEPAREGYTLVEAGEIAGPAIDATAPYVNGPNPFLQMTALGTATVAKRHVDYWADAGATSFKACMQRGAQGGDGVQAGRGLRLAEAHSVGVRARRNLVNELC